MTLVGYWTLDEGIEKENTLFYIIAHKDRTAAKESWAAFINDPDWKIVYEESRENGPLVANIESQFMKPTDYSQANQRDILFVVILLDLDLEQHDKIDIKHQQ